MSRGLGKWERFVMDAVTYPGYDDRDHEYFLHIYNIEGLVSLYRGVGHGNTSFDDAPKDIIFCVESYNTLDAKGKVVYQSIVRAVRSLEKKGFVKSEIVPPDPQMKEDFAKDGYYVRDRKEVSFNSKCLAQGIPWQLRYLNKRLGGKKWLNLYL